MKDKNGVNYDVRDMALMIIGGIYYRKAMDTVGPMFEMLERIHPSKASIFILQLAFDEQFQEKCTCVSELETAATNLILELIKVVGERQGDIEDFLKANIAMVEDRGQDKSTALKEAYEQNKKFFLKLAEEVQ